VDKTIRASDFGTLIREIIVNVGGQKRHHKPCSPMHWQTLALEQTRFIKGRTCAAHLPVRHLSVQLISDELPV